MFVDESADDAASHVFVANKFPCLSRVRRVVMTTLIALLGLIPAAISTKIGVQSQGPLAIVIGSMITTLLLTRDLMPVPDRFYGMGDPFVGTADLEH